MDTLENKLPNAHEDAMRALYKIQDALKRDGVFEAQQYVSEIITQVQNEIDWCYRTDFVAPFILEFFIQLGDTLASLQQLPPSSRKLALNSTVKVLLDLENQQRHTAEDCAKWEKPGKHVDVLEKEHRIRTYKYRVGDD